MSGRGKQQGIDDDKGRGTLAEVCMAHIKQLQPTAFILENVKEARTVHDGNYWKAILNYLSSLGYTLDDYLIDAKFAGVAQSRNRVYLIGRKGTHTILKLSLIHI